VDQKSRDVETLKSTNKPGNKKKKPCTEKKNLPVGGEKLAEKNGGKRKLTWPARREPFVHTEDKITKKKGTR